ncbi:unnamed protein product [Paramecium octaurelia]|uniref:MORN repeat protein n=1 Tax=Paramecium octaurelia TaxID=43137 RepID=A0A8S1WL94_PAROT|nr:unnamed protein product [Paramecium octaurelia]
MITIGLFAVKIGQYSIGNKIGKWIIQYQDQIIGGGYYDEQGQKVGNWVEVHEKFNWYIFNQFLIHCQITFHGFYKNGKRNGFWQYFYYLTLLMGHGRFDENGVKQGKWVELFQNFWSSCQITEEGEYQNGKRVGLWYTIENNKIISGGIYNDKEQKNGIWRDLHENFSCFCEISYEGQYKSGIKVGYWKTIFQSEQHVGGGNYDEKGIRNGRWADLDENFNRNFGTSFVQYIQNYECGLKKGELTQQPFR